MERGLFSWSKLGGGQKPKKIKNQTGITEKSGWQYTITVLLIFSPTEPLCNIEVKIARNRLRPGGALSVTAKRFF